MIQTIRSKDRYHIETDWLSTNWHFSFDHYHDPKNMSFGPLRVFNDDVVAPAGGFPLHSHREMEIVTYVIDGALEQAITQRQPPPGVVVHNDQGVQFASAEFQQVLQHHRMMPSMSRPGNPYDNAFCESFMKTLKQEEIYCNQYKDLEDLSAHLEEFIDHYYNRLRLHSALGYRTPEEFERNALAAGNRPSEAAATVPYFQGPTRSEPSAPIVSMVGKEATLPGQ